MECMGAPQFDRRIWARPLADQSGISVESIGTPILAALKLDPSFFNAKKYFSYVVAFGASCPASSYHLTSEELCHRSA